MENESLLIVVAHPDDEVLGAGGTAAVYSQRGVTVRSCILSAQADARTRRPESDELASDIDMAASILGMEDSILGDFPNIKMNTVPHLELVQFIESSIVEAEPTWVLTHHPSDLNDDHKQVSLACQAAVRFFQRRAEVRPIERFGYVEIPSSTDWAFPGQELYSPNHFVELDEIALTKKLRALEAYQNVMRPHPHPRSTETIQAMATIRGSQAMMERAESFQTVFTRTPLVK